MTGQVTTLSSMKAAIAAAAAFLTAAAAARAGVDIVLVPEQTVAEVGQTVRVRIMLVADSAETELVSAAQVIIAWDPAQLHLLGNDSTGAVPLLSGGFPLDPHGVNEVSPPQDGSGLFLAFAPLMSAITVDQEGVLLGTMLFEGVTPGYAAIDVPAAGGPSDTPTVIFDGGEPNLDITGTRSGTNIAVGLPPVELALDVVPEGPVSAGSEVTVTLSMRDLFGRPVAGFQAFLEFDPSELAFVSGEYTVEPFGSALIDPIAATDNAVNLAAGVDVLGGQAPAGDDALLATLTFQALQPGCVDSVHFRTSEHTESRLSDAVGQAITPLTLTHFEPDPTLCACPCERDGEAGIDVFDLLAYLDQWFAADAAAELTGDSPPNVDVFDLLMYLDCWFAPPQGCA